MEKLLEGREGGDGDGDADPRGIFILRASLPEKKIHVRYNILEIVLGNFQRKHYSVPHGEPPIINKIKGIVINSLFYSLEKEGKGGRGRGIIIPGV